MNKEINILLSDISGILFNIEESKLISKRATNPTMNEMHIIEKIGLREDLRMSDISALMGITTASMSSAANKLFQKGLILRLSDKSDKRVTRLVLSKKGHAVFRLHRRFHANMLDEVLRELTPEETLAFHSSLNKIFVYLKGYKGNP